MALSAGQTLSHYEILGALGAGAMGEVYRARDTRLDREVALKVLPEGLADDEERLGRFEREARALASLNHPNVAQVFGIDRAGDTRFIAMELVPGEDLAGRLHRGALPLAEALDVGRQVAAGVEAAHEAGVVHRDLKPANVIVTPEGRVKVLDFGLAKPTAGGTPEGAHTTEAGRLVGTPTYMAPEQARGKPVDRRVDVWAMGCVLYECLTGRRAFAGETVSDVLAAVLEQEPDWRRLPAATPPALRDLLERCLRKDAGRRLRDAGDARVRLEELAEGGGAVAGEAGRGRPAWPVPVLAVTTVAAVAVAVWALTREEAAPELPGIEAVKPLTNSPAWNTGICWSPGEDFLVYSEVTSRGLDIFRKPARGGVPVPLVETPADDLTSRIAPDGARMAYLTSSEHGTPLRILSLLGDGRDTRVVDTGISTLDLESQVGGLGDRPWFADGRSLLVSILGEDNRLAVHRVDVETGEAVPVTRPGPGENDLGGTLSFAGDRIAFQRSTGGGVTLWTMPVEGGEPVALTEESWACYSPAWRPDGERVVFRRSMEAGRYDLWEIAVRSRETRRLTFETRRIWDFSIAPSGRIAYISSEHDTFLHRVGRSGEAELTRVNARTGDNFGARPSPRGDRIAYHSNQTGGLELWLCDVEGGPETRLTDNDSADMYPDWSPDGSQLVFVSDQDGPFRMFVLDLETGTRRPVGDHSLSTHWSNIVNASILARWSPDPDDPRIAFVVSGDEYALWTIRPDGSDARRVMPNVYGFDWYLDGRRGLATRLGADREVELVAVDVTTGAGEVLLRLPHTEVAVAPDGTAVSFSSGPGHLGMDLYVLELETPDTPGGLPRARGEPVRRTRGQGLWHVHNGGWMPDSQTLVFTRDKDYGDVFELVER